MQFILSVLKKSKNWFLSGVFLLLPLIVTIFIINLLLEKIGGPASKLLFSNIIIENRVWLATLLNLVSVGIVVIGITCFGWFSKYILGKYFIGLTERIIEKLPIAKTVYKTVKQMVETFSEANRFAFQKVVLIEFPRDNVFSIGFVTNRSKSEIDEKLGKKIIKIFVPTTPNPTSGFLLMIPEDRIIELDMDVSDAIKLIISGGTILPGSFKQKN